MGFHAHRPLVYRASDAFHAIARRLPLLALLGICLAPAAIAQELLPRAYWPSPVGTNVVVIGAQRSSGDIVVDQSLPISGVDSEIDYLQASYQRTFSLFGRTATAQISQAFADGTTSGFVDGEPRERRTVGAMDTVGRLAINLRGAPAMDREGMRALRANPRTIIGGSLSLSAPTGQYDADRLINLGTNRWAIKPGVGAIVPIAGGLLLEMEAAAWFFQDNNEFVNGTRKQEPVGNLQLHLVKRFRPGFWGALNANFYVGGRTKVDGVKNSDLQRNSRFGATITYPFAPGQALRLALSTGTVTESGGDYELLSLAWIRAF